MKKIIGLLICLGMLFSFVACDGSVEVEDNKVTSGDVSLGTVDQEEKKLETNDKYADVTENPVVTMEMENGEQVKIELYPKIAPTTVENFISLVNSGFYDGLTFHRVIPTFMAQGGDPSGDGTGGPGYCIKGEFNENGFENNLSHEIGVISMARTLDYDGAGSQFFIVTDEMSYVSLDGQYAAFGKVIEGMDTVFNIVNTKVIRTEIDQDVQEAAKNAYFALLNGEITEEEYMKAFTPYYEQQAELDRPENPPKIKKMTVETFGVVYDEPEKIAE